MNKRFESQLETISNSLSSMDEAVFEKLLSHCVAALDSGHKVIVSGLGKNVCVCDKFVGTMLSLGQNAAFMNTDSAVHGDLGMVNSEDVVIVLTKSGETTESVHLVSFLKQRNCVLWLFSFARQSTLVSIIQNHLVLDLDHEGDDWDIVPNNSTTINLIVLQTLALEIARHRGVTLHDFKLNHPGGAIGVQLKDV